MLWSLSAVPAPAKQAQTDSRPPLLCTRNLHHHHLPHRRRSYDHLRHLLYHHHRHRHRILSLPCATRHCRPPGQVSAHSQASPAVPRHRLQRRAGEQHGGRAVCGDHGKREKHAVFSVGEQHWNGGSKRRSGCRGGGGVGGGGWGRMNSGGAGGWEGDHAGRGSRD